MIFTQLWLVASGNFAWLNWMAIVLAFAAVSDPVAHAVIPAIPLDWRPGRARAAAAGIPPWRGSWWSLVATVLLVVLSYWPVANLFSRHQLMNASFNRWQLVNTYGAFGTSRSERIEIVVEGTLDADPTMPRTGASTASRASPATSAASRGSGRRTTCAWTG